VTILPALVVTLVAFSSAQTPPAKAPFGNKSFGDGGGYKHPDQQVGQYFEIKPTFPEALKDEQEPAKLEAKAIAPLDGEAAPAAAITRERRRPRPRIELPATETAGKAPAKLAATAQTGTSDDTAGDDARRDFETKMLGASSEPRRPGLADPKEAPAMKDAPAAKEAPVLPMLAEIPTGEGMLFVSLELDPQEAGSLRDAVAGLGSAAAFRPDARFQPIPGERGSVRISGWLPVSRLGDAIARPGVKRVSVERGSRPAADDRVGGAYLVTLRVSDQSRPDDSIAQSVASLTAETGFKFERVLGIESVPGGASTALISGTMPVSRLSRALGHSAVVRIASADPVEAAPAAPAQPSRKAGFVSFVMEKGLWLVLLTLLLALPSIGEAVKKGLSVFVPYR